jgi:hypothetical protein
MGQQGKEDARKRDDVSHRSAIERCRVLESQAEKIGLPSEAIHTDSGRLGNSGLHTERDAAQLENQGPSHRGKAGAKTFDARGTMRSSQRPEVGQ